VVWRSRFLRGAKFCSKQCYVEVWREFSRFIRMDSLQVVRSAEELPEMVRGVFPGAGFLGSAWGRVLLLENSGTPKMETSIGSVGEASATLPALASFFVVWRSRTRADARPLKGKRSTPWAKQRAPNFALAKRRA